MPKSIDPKVTGNVTIEMTLEDSKILAEALDAILSAPSTIWVDKTLREVSEGQTCNRFLRALSGAVD